MDTSKREVLLLSRFVVVSYTIAVAMGVSMAWFFFFQDPYAQVAELTAEHLLLDQEIYKETVARLTRDMAIMQEQARIRARLDADITDRILEHTRLQQGLANNTAQRIAGDQSIADRLAREIVWRIDNDTLFQQRIDNATAILVVLQQFELFSMDQFMLQMGNITDILADILAEIATRAAADATFAANDAIIENALVLLASELNAEIATRTAIDDLLRSQLWIAQNTLLRVINVFPIGGDIQLVSTTPTTITVTDGPALDEIFIDAKGIVSFQGVGANSAGNVQFVAGYGIAIDYPAAHTIRVSTIAGPAIAQNIWNAAATYAFGSSTRYVNAGLSSAGGPLYDTMANALSLATPGLGCSVDADCTGLYGPGWTCFTTFLSGVFTGCINTGCTDESTCSAIAGPAWQCLGVSPGCVQLYCTRDVECLVALVHGDAICWNFRCAIAAPDPDFDRVPAYPDAYPNDINTYRQVSQGAVGQAGYLHTPNVISNRPPFVGAVGTEGNGCVFPVWDTHTCGFSVPSPAQSWIVTMTVNIRVLLLNHNNQPYIFFRMFVDRNNGAGFEIVDSEFVAIAESSPGAVFFTSYVTMSSTMIFTSDPIGPQTVSRPIYMGFDIWSPRQAPVATVWGQWYRFSYDATQIA